MMVVPINLNEFLSQQMKVQLSFLFNLPTFANAVYPAQTTVILSVLLFKWTKTKINPWSSTQLWSLCGRRLYLSPCWFLWVLSEMPVFSWLFQKAVNKEQWSVWLIVLYIGQGWKSDWWFHPHLFQFQSGWNVPWPVLCLVTIWDGNLLQIYEGVLLVLPLLCLVSWSQFLRHLWKMLFSFCSFAFVCSSRIIWYMLHKYALVCLTVDN